jgi:hypothetical protein
MRQKVLKTALAICVAMILWTGTGFAEDLKGKFYIGGDLGVLVTTDDVRSNAALIISPLGADGVPFSGDQGEEVSCDATRTDVYCDPRPDDLIARETQLEDTFNADLSFGYGILSWLSLQVDVGYYTGSVKNLDVFTQKNVPQGGRSDDPCLVTGRPPCDLFFVRQIEQKNPIVVAEVTEIPVELNAVFRFRKDSNFNPYVGVGFGYIFTDLKEEPTVDELNERLQSLNIRSVTNEFGPSFGDQLSPPNGDGNVPFAHPMTVELKDGFVGPIFQGGAEYFFNDRISMVFNAKYTIANQEIEILMGGQDQINVEAWTSDMFREDGSLLVFDSRGVAPNPLVDPNNPNNLTRFDCDTDNDGNPNFDEDYDGDGRNDACFDLRAGQQTPVVETVIVQGGTIKLTNFTFGLGVRFSF